MNNPSNDSNKDGFKDDFDLSDLEESVINEMNGASSDSDDEIEDLGEFRLDDDGEIFELEEKIEEDDEILNLDEFERVDDKFEDEDDILILEEKEDIEEDILEISDKFDDEEVFEFSDIDEGSEELTIDFSEEDIDSGDSEDDIFELTEKIEEDDILELADKDDFAGVTLTDRVSVEDKADIEFDETENESGLSEKISQDVQSGSIIDEKTLETVLEKVITKLFAEKIDALLTKTIERTVSKELDALKESVFSQEK